MKPVAGTAVKFVAVFFFFFFFCWCCCSLPLVVVALQSARTCTILRKSFLQTHQIIPAAASKTSICSTTSSSKGGNEDEEQERPGRRERKKRLEQIQQQRRCNRWKRRYGSLNALKETFGTGPPWGDLSPTQTRSLYHTLLPRSLLALNEMGLVKAEDLAPLAYEARIAAKEYARSRCVWTGRVGVFLFDQYRSLRDRGQLIHPGTSSSVSWEDIWAKYEGQIVRERVEKGKKELDEDELMMQTYMRILERSCSTNQTFDNLFLKGDGDGGDISLVSIASQLERDVRTILLSPSDMSKVEKKMKKEEKKQKKEQEKVDKVQRKADRKKENLKSKL